MGTSEVYAEGNLQFDFSDYTVERFDEKQKNAYGLKSVDYVLESEDEAIFLEVKDYQNPKATVERRNIDYEMLIEAGTVKKSVFASEMGAKIKDSLLRKYSLGEELSKRIAYILFINLDKLGEFERGMIKAKISGHVPFGLNDERFTKFPGITFELVNSERLKDFGIVCKTIIRNR